MGERIQTHQDLAEFINERKHVLRLRDAIGFCKSTLEINALTDHKLKYEERVNFEKCLTENFLVKHGYDYFGKRDLIYLDLYGTEDVKSLGAM